ncbi:Signal transduction histidine kinase [Cohaesibacter sp. ES.047]|nr:Signal transduction histidine kinase [Cohaesibacter sp. ES.047]
MAVFEHAKPAVTARQTDTDSSEKGVTGKERTRLLSGFFMPLPEDTVAEHVNAFLKMPTSIYIGHIASALVLLYIAHNNPVVPIWFLFVWATLELGFYPSMMELWRRSYTRKLSSERRPYLWIRLMDMLSLIVGVSWGVMAFWSLNPDNSAHFAIQMSVAAGATAAAIRSLAIFPRSFALYAIPFLGLLATRLMLFGGEFVLLGGLVIIFLLMLLRSGDDVLQSVRQYIAISNENLDLARRYRDAADEADHANREKTRLLAAASHDLRQPIHAIGLYLEALPIDRMEKQSRDTLGRIRNSLDSLSKLFNSLLDVSLLDSGKIKVRPGQFDLRDMLNHILDDYEPLAEIAHVTLTMECPKVGVNGDAILIRRMVQNLVSNSIRHSNGGSVRIDGRSSAGRIDIAVIDDGPGIATEHQAIIFEEFTQISRRTASEASSLDSVEREDRGLGLGLAIVRRLADLQDLELDLISSHEGTSVMIKGLQAVELKRSAEHDPNLTKRMSSPFKQKRLLVVDDDAQTLEATANLLSQWGCDVMCANGMAQLDAIDGPFDLLISDYSFGADYTGIDIVQSARKRLGPHLPALVISGESSEMVQKKLEAANLLLIQKPVQPVQLRSAMLNAFLARDDRQQVIS